MCWRSWQAFREPEGTAQRPKHVERRKPIRSVGLILSIALLAACAEGLGDGSATTTAPDGEPTSTTGSPPVPLCDDTGYPAAPDDWYRDTPIYVGNEMPTEEIQTFASTLEGYETIWIDRDHHGWVSVGFVDRDVRAYQEMLETEFPGVGVVAVEMERTEGELEQIAQLIGSRLPAGMEVWDVYGARGVVEVFVGLLTPERIAMAEAAIGGEPACLVGQDPATTPLPGPQPAGGDGWAYLGEAEFFVAEHPVVVTDDSVLTDMWQKAGITSGAPEVDFTKQVVLALRILHSSSCPVTRLDEIVFLKDAVDVLIVDINDGRACTADGVTRTYFAAVNRDQLPSPPFRISNSSGYDAMVEVDLRDPAAVVGPDDITPVPPETERVAMVPDFVDVGFPWPATLDPSCGTEYLGEISGVSWYRSDGLNDLPPEWDAATVDGLLDVEMVMTEGPEPTLTVTAAGVGILYLPGADEGPACE